MGQETYEVWAQKVDKSWCRIVIQRGEEQIETFESKKDAEAAAASGADSMENREIVVIERKPIMRINAKGIRPKAKPDEDPESMEEELARKKGEVDSPAGGFRLLKNAKKKGDTHEDGLGSVGHEGAGNAGAGS